LNLHKFVDIKACSLNKVIHLLQYKSHGNNMKRIFVLAFVFLFPFQFCKKSAVEYFKSEIIDGVKVIQNFKIEPEKAYKDTEFIEDLSIGVIEGDENYIFSTPVDVDSDNEGNIYVLDYTECNIKKYDKNGNFIKLFGRKGQGPGEFQAAYCMFISKQNEIFVKDAGSRKIEQFSQNGEYERTYNFDMYYYFKLIGEKNFIVDHFAYDEEGIRFLCVGKADPQKKTPEHFISEKQYFPAP